MGIVLLGEKKMQVDEATLKKIEELNKKHEETWGKEVNCVDRRIKMQADKTTLNKIEELNKKHEETWGKEVNYTIIPKGITQEKLVKCLELMIEDNLSLVVAYTKLFKK